MSVFVCRKTHSVLGPDDEPSQVHALHKYRYINIAYMRIITFMYDTLAIFSWGDGAPWTPEWICWDLLDCVSCWGIVFDFVRCCLLCLIVVGYLGLYFWYLASFHGQNWIPEVLGFMWGMVKSNCHSILFFWLAFLKHVSIVITFSLIGWLLYS